MTQKSDEPIPSTDQEQEKQVNEAPRSSRFWHEVPITPEMSKENQENRMSGENGNVGIGKRLADELMIDMAMELPVGKRRRKTRVKSFIQDIGIE